MYQKMTYSLGLTTFSQIFQHTLNYKTSSTLMRSVFQKLQPDHMLAFKGEKCSGSKKSKECLTVLVCASMAGEKGPMLVIGKLKTPRCFAGVKSLPLPYQGNSKAQMTADIFEDYLKKWNQRLARQNQYFLLVVDNCRLISLSLVGHVQFCLHKGNYNIKV